MMTEYEEFMKHLEMHTEEQWVDLTEIVEFFPGIDRKVIDRLLYNNRIEIGDKPDGTQCIRLTAKGRAKLIKQYRVKNPTLLGAIVMVFILFIFKVAPRFTGVYLDEVPKSSIRVYPLESLDLSPLARAGLLGHQLGSDSISQIEDTIPLHRFKEDSNALGEGF
mgnify:CR=1 FL=1